MSVLLDGLIGFELAKKIIGDQKLFRRLDGFLTNHCHDHWKDWLFFSGCARANIRHCWHLTFCMDLSDEDEAEVEEVDK